MKTRRIVRESFPPIPDRIYLCHDRLKQFFNFSRTDYEEGRVAIVTQKSKPAGRGHYNLRCNPRWNGDDYSDLRFQFKNPGERRWRSIPWIVPESLTAMGWDRIERGEVFHFWLEVTK